MNCKDVSRIIISFLSGEATEEEYGLVLEHISSCQKCRYELMALTDIEKKLGFVFKASTAKYSITANALEKIKQKIAEEQSDTKRRSLTESIRKLFQSSYRNLLSPRKLNWKTGFVGIFLIVLIIMLSVTIPMFFDKDSKALALEVALKDPQLVSAFGNREVSQTASEIIIDNNRANVIFNINAELLIIADIDLKTEELIQIFSLELTDEKKQEIIEIARADIRIQELMELGASIDSFYPLYTFFNNEIIGPDGEVHIEKSFEFTVQIRITLPPEEYTVLINLDKGKVISFIHSTN